MEISELKEIGHRKLLIHFLFGSVWRILAIFLGVSMLMDSYARTSTDTRKSWPEVVMALASEAQEYWEIKLTDKCESTISDLNVKVDELNRDNKKLQSHLIIIEEKLLRKEKELEEMSKFDMQQTPINERLGRKGTYRESDLIINSVDGQ